MYSRVCVGRGRMSIEECDEEGQVCVMCDLYMKNVCVCVCVCVCAL